MIGNNSYIEAKLFAEFTLLIKSYN